MVNSKKTTATMKKMFRNLMLVAVAAMAFVACQNDTDGVNVTPEKKVTVEFFADFAETRTSFGEKDAKGYPSSWSGNEKVAFSLNEAACVSANATTSGATANFKIELTDDGTTEGAIYAFSPEGTYTSTTGISTAGFTGVSANYDNAYVWIPTEQTPLANSCDEGAHLIAATCKYENGIPTSAQLQFAPVAAFGKMAITNFTGTIESVTITASEAIAGNAYYYYTGEKVGTMVPRNSGTSQSIKLNATNIQNNVFWFGCTPADLSGGSLKVVITDNGGDTYTKNIDLSDATLNFKQGRVANFSVSFSGIAKDEIISSISLPWIECFDSEDLSKYEIVDGGSATKVYPDDNLANGATKGEILIGKNGGSMTATIASDGKAKTLNLWFKSNKDFIEVSSPTEGVTVTKITNVGYTINLAIGVNTFKVKFTNNNKSNARVDDIVVTEDAPFIESIVADGMNVLFSTGDEFAFNGTVIAIYTNGITEDVTNDVTVDSSAVNMSVAGTYTVTISYNNISTTYDILVQNASVQTKMVELETGTFANNTITWSIDGVTVVQAKGSGNTAVNSAYTTASTMRLYQGHTLTFSCDSNITKIEMVTKGSNYGKTATVDVGTLNNPKTDDCTITWTGSSNKIVLTNGTGSGGSQIQTSSIKITYEVSSETGGDDNGDEGDDATYTSYTEDFTPWTENSTSNTAAGTVVGNACEWAYKGASKQYWSNISEGSSLSFAITLLKPSSADATYVLSEVLHGGIKNLKLTARSNNTSTGVNIYVIDVKTNTTHEIGTLDTTAKKTDANGSYDLSSLNITGDYQIKIANKSTAAYCCIGGLSWNY